MRTTATLLLGTVLFHSAGCTDPTARPVAARSESKNNLKQLAIALHNYHDMHKGLPMGATLAADGGRLHGVHTSLLPMLEQGRLYEQVAFTQPWDAAVNRAPFSTTVPTFLNPAIRGNDIDPAGYAVTHYAENHLCFPDGAALKFQDFTDGLSNTVWMGEIDANLQPWGSTHNRRDVSLGINRSPDGFGSPSDGGAYFVLADGSVRFVKDDVDARTLKSLATPNGGEVVGEY